MNSITRISLLGALGLCLAGGRAASAHIALTCPTARYAYDATGIKFGPCGSTAGIASNVVTHLVAGQDLTVMFTETVGHPGFFRISLDTTGMESFPPISPTPIDPVMAPVLADNVLAHTTNASNVMRMFKVTVPSTPCAKCQLQLTQFMSDDPISGYYECADVIVDAAGAGTPYVCGDGSGGGSGSGGSGSGGSTGSGSGGSKGGGASGNNGGGAGGCGYAEGAPAIDVALLAAVTGLLFASSRRRRRS